jgi:hypothetical protein
MTAITPVSRHRLSELVLEQRRILCEGCAGDPRHPCERCADQRRRIVDLADADTSEVTIAARIGLPVWRVAQILAERRLVEQTDQLSDDWWLLRPVLGARLVARLETGPPAGERDSWPVVEWELWTRLQLEAKGWTPRSVANVLGGSHIPNRPLRDAIDVIKHRHLLESGEPLTSTMLARVAGFTDGTHVDRALGSRACPSSRKSGRTYPGRCISAIAKPAAAALADAAGIALGDIPGL